MALEITRRTRCVAQAAQRTGLGRCEIYNVLWAWEEGGAVAVRARAERCVRRRPHYTAAVVRETARLLSAHPTWGRKRLARALALRGYPTSPSRVRRVLAAMAGAGLPGAQGVGAAG